MTPRSLHLALVALLTPGCGGDDPPPSPYTTEPALACGTSEPLLVDDGGTMVPSGFEVCENGLVHRVRVEARAEHQAGNCTPQQGDDGCMSDDECHRGPNGRCDDRTCDVAACDCFYGGCRSDSDCESGEYCDPFGGTNSCMPAGCSTDADCSMGQLCRRGWNEYPDYAPAKDNPYTLQCTTPEDLCPASDATGYRLKDCTWVGDYFEVVDTNTHDCGRPLTDAQGVGHTAPLHAGERWSAPVEPAAPHPAAAQYWARIGQLEHASVASFLRAGMELMALGAPPDLLDDTLAAARDEVEHAKLAFGLAQRFGLTVVPGAIDGPMAPRATHEDIVEALVREACIGETISALQAADDADRALDPAVRDALRTIADDEGRHALLGWRTLRWLLESFPEQRPVAARAFDAALAPRRPGASEPGCPSLGMPSSDSRARVRAQAIEVAIRPAIQALL